jgi:hypothetical protein
MKILHSAFSSRACARAPRARKADRARLSLTRYFSVHENPRPDGEAARAGIAGTSRFRARITTSATGAEAWYEESPYLRNPHD